MAGATRIRCGAYQRLARFAGKRLRVFSAPRSRGFESLKGLRKSLAVMRQRGYSIKGWGRGIPRVAGATRIRCGAYQRLARFAGKRLRVFSAPRSRGFESLKGLRKSLAVMRQRGYSIKGWGRGIPRVAGATRIRCGAYQRLARFAGKRLRVFSAPRSRGFESLKGLRKSLAVMRQRGYSIKGWGRGIPRVAGATRIRCGAYQRLARFAGKRLRVFSAPRSRGFESLKG